MIKIYQFNDVNKENIFSRAEAKTDVEKTVSDIIANVIENKDKALKFYCEKFDGAKLDSLKVSKSEIIEAEKKVDKDLLEIIKHAASNIRAFHEKQIRLGFEMTNADGGVVGQKITPIESVGVYVPGGTAAYPSTVLMDVIPAKIAGVKRIVMVTPSKNGELSPVILAAAKIAGVNEIYKVGGAQAIAALAYGTESIEKVDKIVGPGNAFVAEAKRQVFGRVSIDTIAGPSEILIVSDGKSNPSFVAADLLSQAEHDKMASAVLITDDEVFAKKVSEELEKQIPLLNRKEIARESIDNNGKIIVAKNLSEAIEISNEIAPEHLELCLDNPFEHLKLVKNAGSVFLGRYTPEALGDYMAGPNHTLPTGGAAKFSSPLSVDDFIKKTQYIYYDEKAEKSVSKLVSAFAKSEGLTAHAKSATIRSEENE